MQGHLEFVYEGFEISVEEYFSVFLVLISLYDSVTTHRAYGAIFPAF